MGLTGNLLRSRIGEVGFPEPGLGYLTWGWRTPLTLFRVRSVEEVQAFSGLMARSHDPTLTQQAKIMPHYLQRLLAKPTVAGTRSARETDSEENEAPPRRADLAAPPPEVGVPHSSSVPRV